MSDWGQESEQLFRSAKRGLSPSHGDRERVRARVAAKLGAAVVGAGVAGALASTTSNAAGATAAAAGAAGGGTAAVATKGVTLALIAKIVAPILVVGAGVVAAPRIAARIAAPSAPSAITVAAAPASPIVPRAATPTVLPTAAAPPVPEPLPTIDISALPALAPAAAPARASSSPASPSAASSAALSAEEALLVGEIDTALRSGDSATALRLSAEHERRFPRGVLSEEREGARVVARCMSGATATSGATAFLAAHPRSPMRARILAACEK